MTRDEIRQLAEDWIAAWNAHDLEAIISHYDERVELISPVAEQLLGIPNGKVSGKASLREYFQRGLEAYPELHFDLKDVLAGLNSLVLYYTNQKGTRTGEFMDLGAGGKVTRVVATTAFSAANLYGLSGSWMRGPSVASILHARNQCTLSESDQNLPPRCDVFQTFELSAPSFERF